MKTIYAITMWSGGQAAKKWQSFEKPELLPQGTGIRFVCRDSRLSVEVIGSVSVEEYESGKDEIEAIREHFEDAPVHVRARATQNDTEGNGIERLF